MNQFFSNIATTTWTIKHVLFEIDYKFLTTHGEGKQTNLLAGKNHVTSTCKLSENYSFYLMLKTKDSLLQLKKTLANKVKALDENVNKQSHKQMPK